MKFFSLHQKQLHPADAEKITETHLEPKLKSKIESYMKDESVVLLGLNAVNSQTHATADWNLPLDLLATAEHCEKIAHHLSRLFQGSKVRAYTAYAELLPPHYDIVKGNDVMVRLFETSACHSYHVTPDGLFVASIPTLLQFFLGMLYADKHFVETSTRQRILCTAQMLVDMAHGDIKRRYKLLTPITCLGKQSTLIDMREEKSELYTSLKKKRSTPEFLEYFFSYNPDAVTPLEKRQLKQKIQNLPA